MVHTERRITSAAVALLAGSYFFLLLWLVDTWWSRAVFLIGLVVGMALLWCDHQFGYRWYQDTDASQPQLLTRSVVTGVAVLGVSLLMVTSTTSLLGRGVTTGLLAWLVAELWWYRAHPRLFQQRFLWQVKRVMTVDEQRQLRWVMTIAAIAIWLIQLRSV